MGRESTNKHLEDYDAWTTKTLVKSGCIGAGIGLVAGIVGGIYLGGRVNDYVEVLKQAPVIIRYAVDVGLVVICGGLGTIVGSVAAQMTQIPKANKRFRD